MAKVLAIFLSLIVLVQLLVGGLTFRGEFSSRWIVIRRRDRPVGYWIVIIIECLVILGAIVVSRDQLPTPQKLPPPTWLLLVPWLLVAAFLCLSVMKRR